MGTREIPDTTAPIDDKRPGVTISTDVQFGVGCLFQASAFAIVLWALYTFSGPFWKLLFNL